MIAFTLVVTQLAVPAALLAWLTFVPVACALDAAMRVLVVCTAIAQIVLVARWDLLSYHLRTLLLLATAAASAVLAARALGAPLWPRPGAWPVTVALGSVEAILLALLARPLRGRFHRPAGALDVTFPLRGRGYCVVHGGSDASVNYHYRHPAQRYAVDVVRLWNSGRRRRGWRPQQLETYRIFRDQVVSPVNGVVLAAINGLPDLIPPARDRLAIAGNHVVIRPDGTSLYLLLAHLECGSVKVVAGERVQRGDPLGLVGNSGNTTEPHLHIHCATLAGDDFVAGGSGVPLTFDGRWPVRNSVIST